MPEDRVIRTTLLALVVWAATAMVAQATPHPGQSQSVGIISDTFVINGGEFPTTTSGPSGSFTDFTFTNIPVASVNAATLAAHDTVLLNVASTGMGCDVNNLSAAQKTDLVNFLNGGGKLIIYDSECPPQDYSWLPRPFTTANPGALGGTGTVNIVEDNFLGTDTTGDPHFIDEVLLGQQTDAVGDMNVLTTQDPNICLHMSGTNAANQAGPTHVYYTSGSGLLIYNGFDVDFLSSGTVPDASTPDGNLAKIWLQELQQPRDGSGLACAISVVGISLTPQQATNAVGTSHTVTATVTDQGGAPRPNVLVTFQVTGANAGASGTCNPVSCQTDANGQVTFTYAGTTVGQDGITACFTQGSSQVCSAQATKTWTGVQPPPGIPGCEAEAEGRIMATNGDKATFSLDVEGGPPPKGKLRYRDRGPAEQFRLNSTEITEVAVSADGTQATIIGKAEINRAGSFDFRVEINNPPGKQADTFRIRLSNGYDSGEQIISDGDVDLECDDEDDDEDDD
jgi:Bacterial Ig-like domain (group 1)